MARVVVPGHPHHITQRGNRRQETFFCEDDYSVYCGLMAEWCGRCGVEIWAYCLMPNHVHLIAVPASETSLRQAIGEAHRRYTRHINFREGWRGCLWQGRFASFVMDEKHTLAAARYIELNPSRARLLADPTEYPYSSVAAHLDGKDNSLVRVRPLLELVSDWGEFLAGELDGEEGERLRAHERTGRPLGSETFLERLERKLGRPLRPQPGGRPRKGEN